MKKAELLAPAGNYAALKGAVNAGADAIYLGGELYGARAYADNFTQDEICLGIHYAHVFGKKIYLTVNTLVKEKELDSLYDFLLPLYERGLDGVIIQDLGVLRYLKSCFPNLALHASTQMTLTGSRGAAFVKKEGISRIVPARELSLEELKKIKAETGVEIEAFIHGAMCYCYSGQCLFSSILGGRSGNRGRCAQPCRLPYETKTGNSCYPLSMKDMCTIGLLPELIDAGIDSFKIEGRMKKPAYAAGVTAIYRKYIDLYYQDKEHYHVTREDMDILNALYIRSEIGDGYYKRHNARDMISLNSPAYLETAPKLLAHIEKKYIEKDSAVQAHAKIFLTPGKPALLTLYTKGFQVSCKGEPVQKAVKQPLTEEKIAEQIQKSGNSLIQIQRVDVIMHDKVFLPVRALNELRRTTVKALETEIIKGNGLDDTARKSAVPSKPESGKPSFAKSTVKKRNQPLHVLVQTVGQLDAAREAGITRIYLDYSFLEEEKYEKFKSGSQRMEDKKISYYLAAPYVVREKDIRYLEKIERALEAEIFQGVLVRNLESFQFFCEKNLSRKTVLDANLYLWNRETVNFWEGRAPEFYLPVECNRHEWKELLAYCDEKNILASAIIYGRLPMMVTANCLKKTTGRCQESPDMIQLKDRYAKIFPVYTDCLCCYNIIYNSIPLSIHELFRKKERRVENFRLDFTTEKREETAQIIHYFMDIMEAYREPFYKEYTTGHYKRGVE